jgi:hypothetical protein
VSTRGDRLVLSAYGAAAALTLAAVGRTAWHGLTEPGAALAFGAVVALGGAARVVRSPLGAYGGDRDAAPLAAAGALAYALLGPGRHSVGQTVTVVTFAALAGALPHALRRSGGRHARGAGPYRRAVTVVSRAGLRVTGPRPVRKAEAATSARHARSAARTGGPSVRWRSSGWARTREAAGRAVASCRAGRGDGGVRRVVAVGFAAVCCRPLGGGRWGAVGLVCVLGLTALCDAALAAGLGAARSGHPYQPALRDEVRALAGIGSAVCAGGVVMALAVGAAGLWALPVVAVPLLLTQMSLRGQAAVRATYRQTIGSLARATEVAGYTPAGHARRVSELATAVGRELGLPARHLLLLEYAALMHDIGQLSLVDPVPRGATEPLAGDRQRAIAALGGEVVRRTGAPAQVALIVERQAHPYREQPLAGRIVRAVNAYEDLTGEQGALDLRLAAVERLRLATAHEYDPRVVAALTRVLARRPTWAWLDAHGTGKGVG